MLDVILEDLEVFYSNSQTKNKIFFVSKYVTIFWSIKAKSGWVVAFAEDFYGKLICLMK